MSNISYGEYLVHVGETAEQLRETSGDAELEGIYLKTAEIFWQIARDPDCPESSRVARLREMSEQGIPVELLRDLWNSTGGQEDLFTKDMAQALSERLRSTPVEKEP